MDPQELAKLHPLFTRLTGQVIWTLFEESGASPQAADAFMDRYLAWREACLRAVEPVLLKDPAMPPYIQVLADGAAWGRAPGKVCPSCAALDGLVIDTSHPHAVRFLPPYSLGCRARPLALSHAAFAALASPQMVDLDAEPPRRKLTCDTDWILDHAWA